MPPSPSRRFSLSDLIRRPVRGFQLIRDWLAIRGPSSEEPVKFEPQPEPVRDKIRAQVELIRRALDNQVGVSAGVEGDDGDTVFMFRPDHVLVRAEDVGALDEFFGGDEETYDGRGVVAEEPMPGLARYRLPARRDTGRVDVLATLDDLDASVGEGIARPDHVFHVTPKGSGSICPAAEPAVPSVAEPLPALATDAALGTGIRVSVVDTGWHPPAAAHVASPWLVGVFGEDEKVDDTDIHAYAGHGTFVAGVIRCLAPATRVEIEGFLRHGGSAYESEITKQLNQAMTDKDRPQLISISAGTHTRKNLGLLGFEVLAEVHRLFEGDDAVLVVAAAGNDGNDEPFWPAAYPDVLGVGAVDEHGLVCTFSNVGPWVDVYAHGQDLVNAFPVGTYTCKEPANAKEPPRTFAGLATWSGTSFATPVVTGTIAAHMSKHGVSARASRDALLAAAPTQQDPRAGTVRVVGPPFT